MATANLQVTPKTFTEADEFLGKRPSKKLGNNTYLERDVYGRIAVRHHETNIVVFRDGASPVIRTGGWDSMSTIGRLNALTPSWLKLARRDGFASYSIDDGKTWAPLVAELHLAELESRKQVSA